MSNKDSANTTARINKIPIEILAHIFALSKKYCFRPHSRGDISLSNITAVCKHWRQLALDTPALWTHIDIGPVTPTKLTQISLKRTKDKELHVHVYDPQPEVPSQLEEFKEMSRKVIPMLKPHIHRVRSLDLESYAYSTNFVASVLNLWLNHGNPQIARSLFIHRPYFDGILSVDEPKPGTRISQSKKAKQVLLSVTTLHTSGSILPWDSSAYRDLVELKLQFHRCEASASESQLAALLSASPKLVTLRLASLLVTRTPGWSQPAPVLLSRLKILDLVDVEPDSLELLLPLIAVPDSPDDLSVAVPFDSEPQTALEGFFARSRITTLYCYHPYTYLAPRPSLLRSLPHIETVLILHQLLFDGNDNSTNSEPPRSSSTSLIPNVIVVSCKVTFEGLKDLVAMHQIQNLRLQRCELPDSIKDSQSLEDIHNSMLRIYPDLKLSIEDDDITWSHPIRTWDKFNW